MKYPMALILICLLSLPLAAQSPSKTLAPTGMLRAIFLGGNPVQGRVDQKSGEATWPVPDLVREIARRLGVPYKIIPAEDAQAILEALKSHSADIGFLAYDETRAREADFGAAFEVMFNSYLVPADSAIKKSADVDRAGLKVAAVKGHTGVDVASGKKR